MLQLHQRLPHLCINLNVKPLWISILCAVDARKFHHPCRTKPVLASASSFTTHGLFEVEPELFMGLRVHSESHLVRLPHVGLVHTQV